MLTGKKILLAVTGSIAAYKAAFFVRLLVQEGAEVKVIMTEAAKDFISPLTLATLSKNPVYSAYFDRESGEWHSHVELGIWADLMIVAPLTANTLAKLANGYCDNLLCATYLSVKCPVMLAPAMDLDMYLHETTKTNLQKLASYGNLLVDAEEGELASGLHGKGRMAEPEHLLEAVQDFFNRTGQLSDTKVLITSGPTYEAIDPVRFIGNHSSGKMGAALAVAFVERGASVTFVTGPARHLPAVSDNLQIIRVNTAREMLNEVSLRYDNTDLAVFAAAVSDFGVEQVSDQKLKRNGDDLTITLTPNPDIAAEMGRKKKKQLNVGFALETTNEKTNAIEKLAKKNFDMIILNSLNDQGAGFSHDTNQVTVFDSDNNEINFGLRTKAQLAKDLVGLIAEKIKR